MPNRAIRISHAWPVPTASRVLSHPILSNSSYSLFLIAPANLIKAKSQSIKNKLKQCNLSKNQVASLRHTGPLLRKDRSP